AFITCVAVLGALVHAYLVGHDSARPAMRILWMCYLFVLFGLAVQYRILRPLKMWRKPWEVVENITENGSVRTLLLRPVADSGFSFAPGPICMVEHGQDAVPLRSAPHLDVVVSRKWIERRDCIHDQRTRRLVARGGTVLYARDPHVV